MESCDALRLGAGAGDRSAAVPAPDAIARRSRATASTSPTCALASSWPTSAPRSRRASSPSFAGALDAGGAVVALALSRRGCALAARLRRAHRDRQAVRRQGHGLDCARCRRHQIVGVEVPQRRERRGRNGRARCGDRRRDAALRRRTRVGVRGRRKDAQRSRRPLRSARSAALCLRLGYRLSVSRDRRGDRRADVRRTTRLPRRRPATGI